MRKQFGNAIRRAVCWILAAAAIGAPAASGAATWVGQTHERLVCTGLGHENAAYAFTLEMDPGTNLGTLTYAGETPIQVITQWTNDGKWAYFTAVGMNDAGDYISLYGYTRGARMKGWLVYPSWSSDCLSFGALRAYAQ